MSASTFEIKVILKFIINLRLVIKKIHKECIFYMLPSSILAFKILLVIVVDFSSLLHQQSLSV